MTIGYRDAVVAITGADGGIGRELALLLGRRGARLVLSGRRQERLEAVRDEVAAAGARSEALMVAPCDVTTLNRCGCGRHRFYRERAPSTSS